MKKLSDVLSKEVVNKIVCNKLNTKVNNLENKIPNATSLIHLNQCNTYKQNLEKKMMIKKLDVDKETSDVSGLVIITVLNTKIVEVENRIRDVTGLETISVLNTKIGEVENKIPDHSICIYFDS